MRKLSLSELNRDNIEAFKRKKKLPVVLVLDNIRSALNVGSAFRTADGIAIEKIYILGISAKPPHREIQKTAIGATESVEWEYFEDGKTLIDHLKEEKFNIIPIEQADNSTYLNEFKPIKTEKYALIFGNEVKGVSDVFMEESKQCIEVPQFGTKHSFNVSVCVGIVLWDFWSKLA